MFSDTVTYEDFNGKTQTDRLWFNISKTDLSDDLALLDRVEEMQKIFTEDKRDLTTPEKQELLNLVKTFLKLAYGVKTADGKQFRKTDDIWDEFRWSPAYDAYLWSLFEDLPKAFGFIVNALPKDAREQLTTEQKQQLEVLEGQIQAPLTPAEQEVASQMSGPAPSADIDDRPDWLREGRAPSQAELKASPKKYHAQAFELWSKQ